MGKRCDHNGNISISPRWALHADGMIGLFYYRWIHAYGVGEDDLGHVGAGGEGEVKTQVHAGRKSWVFHYGWCVNGKRRVRAVCSTVFFPVLHSTPGFVYAALLPVSTPLLK